LGFPAKALFAFAGALSVVAGLVLWLFPDRTADYFAWTIKNPLTAVFMGASYLAGAGTLAVLRTDDWAAARVQLPFIIVFGSLQLLASLLNLSTFNIGHLLAWGWLACYVVSPVVALIVYFYYERAYVAPARPARGRLPLVGVLILALTALHVLVGSALLLFPGPMATIWPWGLTQLTAQVLAGWYIAGAVSVWVRATQPAPELGQIGQIAGYLTAPLLLIGGLRFLLFFTGPTWSKSLYVLDVLLAGGLLVYLRWRAGRRLAA
jgi:hypothetical protein